MPYCAPSVNGMQCQAYSCEPSLRGAGRPAQPGISSLVRRGCRPGFISLNLTSRMERSLGRGKQASRDPILSSLEAGRPPRRIRGLFACEKVGLRGTFRFYRALSACAASHFLSPRAGRGWGEGAYPLGLESRKGPHPDCCARLQSDLSRAAEKVKSKSVPGPSRSRHCEEPTGPARSGRPDDKLRDEAIQHRLMDCFAPLAMTQAKTSRGACASGFAETTTRKARSAL